MLICESSIISIRAITSLIWKDDLVGFVGFFAMLILKVSNMLLLVYLNDRAVKSALLRTIKHYSVYSLSVEYSISFTDVNTFSRETPVL